MLKCTFKDTLVHAHTYAEILPDLDTGSSKHTNLLVMGGPTNKDNVPPLKNQLLTGGFCSPDSDFLVFLFNKKLEAQREMSAIWAEIRQQPFVFVYCLGASSNTHFHCSAASLLLIVSSFQDKALVFIVTVSVFSHLNTITVSLQIQLHADRLH